MRAKKSVLLQKIADQSILVDMSGENINCNRMITLNAVGEFVWEAMSDDISAQELTAKITERFDVQEQVAKKDLLAFISELEKLSFVEND
ncbi:MAG: PqqD family protein [Clostridia bacterium]